MPALPVVMLPLIFSSPFCELHGLEERSQASTQPAAEWREAEAAVLENHVQLTFADRFYKAGESYFNPDNTKIIFQAVEATSGEAPDEFYAMFIADVVRDGSGRILRLDDVERISPAGSANTCGWFHPTEPDLVLFATTLGPPSPGDSPGYQRSGRYKWAFPPEMRIVSAVIDDDFDPDDLSEFTTLVRANGAYVAEGSWDPIGQNLLYCSLAENEGDI